jgi:hypothetical protein
LRYSGQTGSGLFLTTFLGWTREVGRLPVTSGKNSISAFKVKTLGLRPLTTPYSFYLPKMSKSKKLPNILPTIALCATAGRLHTAPAATTGVFKIKNPLKADKQNGQQIVIYCPLVIFYATPSNPPHQTNSSDRSDASQP